jgi:uncharacterized membrane protein (Fun14 family)
MQTTTDSLDGFLTGSGWLTELGPAFIVGLAVGYFAKKILRIGLFLFGALVVGIFLLDQSGLFHIAPESIEGMATTVGNEAFTVGGFLRNRLDAFSGKGLSAGVGFLAGLKLG